MIKCLVYLPSKDNVLINNASYIISNRNCKSEMLITKQVQNHQFKRNKLHHSSFLLKEQGYLAKLNDFSICNHYSSSTQTPKKRSQWNTRAKSAYSKKNKSNID